MVAVLSTMHAIASDEDEAPMPGGQPGMIRSQGEETEACIAACCHCPSVSPIPLVESGINWRASMLFLGGWW
jgi:hypothetical protein